MKHIFRTHPLGRLGVWLCDHCYPRPVTRSENATTMQYAELMIKSLEGRISWYGRDRASEQVIINEKFVQVQP